MQDYSISSALAAEILQSCPKPSIRRLSYLQSWHIYESYTDNGDNIILCILGTRSAEYSDLGRPCVVYGMIKEKDAGVSMTICSGRERRRHLYTTMTNSLEIYIDEQTGEENISYFILEYGAINAFPHSGCTNPPVPAQGVLHREGDRATIRCMGDNAATWDIVCQDGQWLGVYGNCSTGTATGRYITSMV